MTIRSAEYIEITSFFFILYTERYTQKKKRNQQKTLKQKTIKHITPTWKKRYSCQTKLNLN